LFLKALDLNSPGERQEYLDNVCAGDSALRAEVEALLEASGRAGSFLTSPAVGLSPVPTVDEQPIRERPGTVIGPYKLMEQIGEGGMGLVFVAEQQHPVRRKVALKVIKPGMDTRQVIARFEAERQALALMDHPNIAKVYDGGTTRSEPRALASGPRSPVAYAPGSEGRPYFVMELVKGVPITEYCDQKQVSVSERLQLFLNVCEAVQHAHQKGIIHRDIKPSNVMVVSHDGKPVVKVIDFGVAKAIGQQLTDKTVYTHFAQLIGTPLYMSPEQAGESGLDVDTRGDIYSLGVLLYELLTGTTPFDKERFKTAAYDEMRRIIREEEPPKPSTRISTLGQAAATVSTNRQTDAKQLSRLFRGELDWIVMKALEKDRNRRYESASAFAADVQRYLSDEPVQAFPPSAWYRVQKFVRRNGARLAIGGLLLSMLLAAALSTFLVRERAAREKAAVEETARKNLEIHLYYQTIALAEREQSTGHIGRAEQLLDEECPAELRGWEWHYLKRHRFGGVPPLRHTSGMFDLAMSRDGRHIAAAGDDGFVKIWNVGRLEESLTFQTHQQHIHRLAFSPDQLQLATGSWDETVKIWDVRNGRPIQTLNHGSRVFSIAYSPDGRWLISGGDSVVKVWDTNTRQRLYSLPGHSGDIQCLTFSPDGRILAVSSASRCVNLVNTGTWETFARLNGHAAPAIGMAFSPDGTQLAVACGQFFMVGEEGEVRIWDVRTTQPIRALHGHTGGAFAVAFTPDGRRLASAGNEDATIKLWDVRTGLEALVLRGHTDSVWGLAFSPDGNRLYSAGGDQTVRVWDATVLGNDPQPGARTLSGHTQRITSLAFSPAQLLLASASIDRTIRIWDAATGQELRTLTGHTGPVQSLAFSPDGLYLASASWKPNETLEGFGELKLWDTSTWQTVRDFSVEDSTGLLAVAFRPDGERLVAATADGLDVYSPRTGARIRTFPGISFPTGLAFTSRGRLFTTDVDGTLRQYDLSLTEEVGPVAALLTAPQGMARLLSAWTATTGLSNTVIPAHNSRASCVAVSPSGAYVASAGLDGLIKFWDAQTLKPLGTLEGHVGGVHSLAFDPSGRFLASAGKDATIRIWNAERREVLALRGHADTVWALSFSADGRYLASGGSDKTVKIWDLPPLLEKAQR
jgi:WD40 repeat protein/serine/threonine protein kinase